MKSWAFSSQRTGQPRCVQLTAKAVKVWSSLCLSQAADLVSMPAYCSASALSKLTRLVVPMGKSSMWPTARQKVRLRSSSGATRAATTGTAMTAALMAAMLRLSRVMNSVRPMLALSASCFSFSSISSLVFMTENVYPTYEGDDEYQESTYGEDPSGDEAPGDEGHAHGEEERVVGGVRHLRGLGQEAFHWRRQGSGRSFGGGQGAGCLLRRW